ncbi:hypothetical protein LTR37_002039 [Vermiconidia calcicola]|uniref:Uncharacterized protein n=1 Tax=Vermiconidia calcicola TaxID=1690605 RepID=A0ACC3NVB0_9PEZI|nr:hypothetical protein LTR37_002039 [Vermiconidia calcicola]
MKDTFINKLYNREINEIALRSKSYRKLYGDRRLVQDLDIVNELDGHSGCVNALSWSKSGGLLASGSDDQHLNVHAFQPDNANSQFRLATTVATGHTANIFSVKFMPHSNDRTVITAAGDAEVRIFDLEYAGQAREASHASSIASEGRRSRRNNVYNGVRYLSDGDTDCRVYRSHGDRVKRIVTESSPHLFLTCSEDGEIRQWDLRQPSSAYPAPRGGRFSTGPDESLPPPLISYKRFQLDLNSISCSASQPHYIALGGAHLHAFLHDRRMTGRDRLREAGKPLTASSNMSSEEEELMNQATQCVRKFAPSGRRKMKRTENGHITALKISDARPNEMIASWSGDHIYSFDLVRSPDADDADTVAPLNGSANNQAKEGRDRKRKRQANGSQSSLSQTAARPASRSRTEEPTEDGQDTALRIRYQNGQSEDIPLSVQREQHRHGVVPLTLQQREAQRIAKASVKIRSSLFGSTEEGQAPDAQFTAALSHAVAILTDVDEVMRDWRYPMEPSAEIIVIQQTLRHSRESTRRFVQAAGALARVLDGKLQTPSGTSPLLSSFMSVEARSNDLQPSQKEQFGYDFLKAITLWLESGVGRLIEGFTRPYEMVPTVKAAQRLPIPASEASTEAIDEYLIPYLLRLAVDKPITNVETNRFEVDENRQLFESERAAVLAFAAAVKIPFADLSSAVSLAEGADYIQAQDRQTAKRYWGSKVGRGVLMNAAEGVNFTFVSRAFGGPGRVVKEVAAEEAGMEDVSEDEEQPVGSVEVLDREGSVVDGANADGLAAGASAVAREEVETEQAAALQGDTEGGSSRQATAEPDDDGDDDENNDDDNDDEDEDMDNDSDDEHNDTSSEASEEDGVPNTGMPRFMYASAYERRRLRDQVAADVACSGAIRSYRGHCNVKTVKDVNYFGLDDEYIVSGSDDGNFFIWDRKTSELVNVLEGDGEVVNVIQGHPYETMMAVSGIDHTIKIFSPDARARESARLGQGVSAHDTSDFSSLAWPSRLSRRRVSRRSASNVADANTTAGATTSEPAVAAPADPDHNEDESYVSATGLASRRRMHDSYRIMNQNDVQRQGGNQDAFLTVRDLHPLLLIMGRPHW